jgi:hypothetical protein
MKKAAGLTRLNRELGGKRLELPKGLLIPIISLTTKRKRNRKGEKEDERYLQKKGFC